MDREHKISELFWSLVGQLLISAIIGLAAMIWGLLSEGIAIWYAVIGGILTTAALFYIISNSGWWRPPLNILINQWLDNSEFSIRKMSDNDCNFMFHASDRQNRQIIINQQKGKEKFIFFLMGHNISKEIHGFDEKSQKILGINLRNKLALKGLHYRNVVPPFDKFSIELMIPVVNIEQRDFLEALHRVFQGWIICAEEVLLAKETYGVRGYFN